jgi:hypothetical protein
MPDNPLPRSTPQFGTAEYSSGSADTCDACHQPITEAYYRAKHNAMLCGGCVERFRGQIPQDCHAAFVRGVVFGLGGFGLGLILYAGFTILTGVEIGFVSLAVGWLVGKAMMMGSGGAGGRRYQIVAVLLTYAAVSMAFIPIAIHYMKTHPEVLQKQTAGSSSSAEPSSTAQSSAQPGNAIPPSQKSFASRLATLAMLGLASPFLQLTSGFSGLIGLIILFVGMQFAWKITRGVRLAITGPFQASASAKA